MIKLTREQMKAAAFGIWIKEKKATRAYKLFKPKVQKCPCYKTFQRWFKEFKGGNFNFKDKPRSGRPSTVVTKANVDKIREIVVENRKISIRKLVKITALKRSSIRNIVIKKLKMKKLAPIKTPYKMTEELKLERKNWCAKMFQTYSNPEAMNSVVTADETYFLYDQVQEGREWRFDHEDTPRVTKLKRLTTRKRMFSMFFNKKGIVHVAFRPLNVAANAKNYKLQLQTVVKKLAKDGAKVVIHDDNAPIHCAKLIKNYYKRSKVTRMTHPRYSPDLAPNDFWLIRKVKRALSRKNTDDEQELYDEVMKIVTSIPAEEYARCFDEWLKRMQRCIDKDGDYFEYRTRSIKRKR